MLKLVIVLLCLVGTGFCLPRRIGNRVVNGTDADEGEFPFVVSLRSSSGSHSCGCSIISKTWLLTAAHCVVGKQPSSVSVQYGVTKISPNGQNVARISKIIVHEGYNPGNNYKNDIALMQLEQPLEYNEFVQPINLPEHMMEMPGRSPAQLVGWGLNSSSIGGTIQVHLQKADLVTFSDEECQDRHNGRPHLSNICAGVPEGGKGQCNGDSGGPLFVDNTQIGIVSWSIKPCTIAPYPGVYTKVSHFVDWIKERIDL